MDIAASGKFWVPQTPEVQAQGRLTAERGKTPKLVLESALVDDPRVKRTKGGIVRTDGATSSVKAFLPITVQGRLDSGELVTLLNARNRGGPGWPFENPQYRADCAIVGDHHVSGQDQTFSGLRFRFGAPYWLGHLEAGARSEVGSDGSTIEVEHGEDGNWLLYTPAAPVTMQRFESLVVMGCLTLAELAFDQEFAARDTQVRIDEGDKWLAVHGPSANTPPGEASGRFSELVPREELTLERFAGWIPLNDKLDGLASAVSRHVSAPLQTEVLLATALLEGLHRRLPERFEQSKFPAASNKALEKVKQAARRAARENAEGKPGLDSGAVHGAVKDAVGHFDAVDYMQRAEDVVATVGAALPEIAESVTDLPKLLKDARNEMAHQVPLDHAKEPLEVRYLRWLVVAETTPWLLRTLLLLLANIDPAALREQHLSSSRFFYFRANVAQLVEELGWELPRSSDEE